MARDPVCGMQVSEGQDVLASYHKGQTYYFCSDRCKRSFEDNPDAYLQAPEQVPEGSRKVVVVGTGAVGSTFAYAMMISGLVGQIVLIDQDRKAAEGHVMDLNHGLSFVKPCKISTGDYEDCRDAHLVVITAGAAQKPGETRLDLVRKNTEIFKEMIPQIARYDPRILLVVTNPVDVLTYVAIKLSGYSMNRVMGSGTTLDTARFRYLLSRHCGVDPRNVHAYVIGEHGDTEVAIWSHANIGAVPLTQYCPTCHRHCPEGEREALFEQVKNAAYEIINRKGATNFAIGLALVRIAESVLRDENSVLTVSSLIDGYHDIRDVCLSIPAIVNRNGIAGTLKLTLDEKEREGLRHSAAVLKEVISQLRI
jgi:L-lactate dehydrogenase